MPGQKAGTPFYSLIHSRIADTIGNIGYASPRYIEKLSQLLDWPYWEVRMKVAQALGKLDPEKGSHPVLALGEGNMSHIRYAVFLLP